MNKLAGILFFVTCICGCKKHNCDQTPPCDIQKQYIENAGKVTIPAGIWGTVSSMEGNCMPPVQPSSSTCRNCPVKRTVKIYQYTLLSQAVPSTNSLIFFESFSTQLVAQVNADEQGFFQANIPPGHYTIAIVENGKLYANGTDGQGGIHPVTYSSGKQQVNLTMTYKAAF